MICPIKNPEYFGLESHSNSKTFESFDVPNQVPVENWKEKTKGFLKMASIFFPLLEL